jgi:hypothetical protein
MPQSADARDEPCVRRFFVSPLFAVARLSIWRWRCSSIPLGQSSLALICQLESRTRQVRADRILIAGAEIKVAQWNEETPIRD